MISTPHDTLAPGKRRAAAKRPGAGAGTKAQAARPAPAELLAAPPVPELLAAPPEPGLLEGPTREDLIRRRAYTLYERNGCVYGRAMDDWLTAEAELEVSAPVESDAGVVSA